MSEQNEDRQALEEWFSGMALEEQVMKRIMDAYLEGSYNYNPNNLNCALVTTTEIMDATSDIGPLTADFVNRYMIYRGYQLTKASGRVMWRIWK